MVLLRQNSKNNLIYEIKQALHAGLYRLMSTIHEASP